MKSLIDEQGNMKPAVSLFIGILGAALIFFPLYLELHPWIIVLGFIFGMTFMGFSAYATKSATLDLRAFNSDPLGWRKSKKSYDKQESGKSGNSGSQ